MAKKKRATLPPMLPRVDVAKELAKPGRLGEVAEVLSEVDQRGFLGVLREQLKRERGALVRASGSLPRIVREAEAHAGRLCDAVQQALALATFVVAMRAEGEPKVGRVETQLASQLQRLADMAFDSQLQLGPAQCEAVAGLGGETSLWGASSGIEATTHLAWDVCRVVRGVPSLLLAMTRPASSKAERPAAAALDPKDSAILRALFGGADSVKSVSLAATRLLRRPVTEQSVRHRKPRLVQLGYLQPKPRYYGLTKKGEAEASAMDSDGRR